MSTRISRVMIATVLGACPVAAQAILNVIAAGYLTYWGFIGWRSWA